MKVVYKTTLKTILYLCKFVGIINVSYILESDGLLIQSKDSIYKCLEIARMLILMIFTYSIHTRAYFTQKIFLLKLWTVIIASRISETWVIQLMNGIIEYDQKLTTSLPKCLMIRQLFPKKNFWNIIFIFTLIYYIACTFLMVYLWPPTTLDITTIALYFIRMDFITDVTVIFSSYFFLQQLEYRFQTLNDSWKYLLPGFLAIPEELTHSITRMTLDNMRLLHAELSDLLRIFSEGFGKMLLGFFVFSFINMIISFYYSIIPSSIVLEEFNFDRYLIKSIPYIINLQNVIWTLSIIIAASRVHEKKRKMISYLRLIKISNLSANLKAQVKSFMNQISVFESSELTAFGIFNINLNLVVSILILLVTGLITMIQMKEHPILLQSKQNLKKFMQSLTNENLT